MVRILVISDQQYLKRQLIPQRFQNIEFVFDPSTDYDYIAVIDSVDKKLISKVPKSKRILYIGEPPYIKPYLSSYLAQYGTVVGPYKLHHSHFKVSHPILPWFVGNKQNLGAIFFQSLRSDDTKRRNKFCIITSNKCLTRGHRKRVEFVERLKKEHPELLDVYGNGYKPVDDKFEVLSKYKFCLAIENCVCENYWTEKIGDAFLSECIPCYYGCPNIDDYFPKNSFIHINIDDYGQSVQQMRMCISRSFDHNIELRKAKDLVIEQYNLFERINADVNDLMAMTPKIGIYHTMEELYPYRYTWLVKIKQYVAWKWNIIV